MQAKKLIAISTLFLAGALVLLLRPSGPAVTVAYAAANDQGGANLDSELAAVLANAGLDPRGPRPGGS